MNFTKRNHYNPCFWTAHWNSTYLERAIAGDADLPKARDQRVVALNVKSGTIYETTADNLHFDKDLGVAEITPDDAKDFCKRNFPDQYAQFCHDMENDAETVYYDFEDILSGLEKTQAYTTLRAVIIKQKIDAPTDKAFLAAFIVIHWLRSHAMMNAMIELWDELGMKKFEYFWGLKHSLSNTEYLFQLVMSIAPFHWRYYRVRHDTFPLNDSPVLIRPNNVMVALSPRLLLEIDRTREQSESTISCENCISAEKLDEFRQRTIANTFREIIFGNKQLLEKWRASEEFRARHQLLTNTKRYNARIAKHGNRELWNINALANI